MKYANYDESTGLILGFYEDEIHPDIPLPKAALTEAEWQDCIDNSGFRKIENGTVIEYVPSPPTIEEDRAGMVVSRLQGELAMHRADVLAAVETLMSDPAADVEMVIAWKRADTFSRISPVIAAAGLALGWTDAFIDDLFRAAALIEA